MKIFPAVHYTMGGLWVDYQRSATGGLEIGSPRNQQTSIPGVYARIVAGGDHGFAFLPGDVDLMAGWLTEYLTYQRPR